MTIIYDQSYFTDRPLGVVHNYEKITFSQVYKELQSNFKEHNQTLDLRNDKFIINILNCVH